MCKHLKQDYSLYLQILCQNSIYMKKYPCILSIAGSDCSGGAGIQADLKTISALGGYAATAITAITVQNTTGVRSIHAVPPVYVQGQIEAVMEDICPHAVKIGMINDVEIVKVIGDCLRKYRPRYVVFDPVMVSTSGHKLIEDDAISALARELIPLSTLITPNLSEAEVLAGHLINKVEDMEAAARELLKLGCHAVLLKGGHLEGGKMCDVLQVAGEEEAHLFTSEKVESRNTHGTGCTLSSAIATFLALGCALPEAVERAKSYVTGGIIAGKDIYIGEGHGPLNHFYAPVAMNIREE